MMCASFVAPEFKRVAFHCPMCGVFSHVNWMSLTTNGSRPVIYYEAVCSHCSGASLWRALDHDFEDVFHQQHRAGEMIYPDFGGAPPPIVDMPEDVKKDYAEAARIFSKSPRGAAALLRLGLQKLCVHLGQQGKNIDNDIRELAKAGRIPPLIVSVADTVRIVGNNAVYPGEMSDEDFDHVASKLFDLLNVIVDKAIVEPRELKRLYERVPEGPRRSAEAKDAALNK
jgi:hypothetical protein